MFIWSRIHSRGEDNNVPNPDIGDNDINRTSKMDATDTDEQWCGIAHSIGQRDGERYLYDLSIDTKKSTESSLLLPQGGRIPENELSQDNMSDGGLSYEIGLIEAASNDKLINHRGGDDEDDDEGEDNDQSDGNLSRDNHHLTSKKDLIDSHSLKAQDLVHIDLVADEIATFPIREITDFDPASIAKHSILLLYLVPQQGYLSR